MSLLYRRGSPLNQVYVSLDLETTGLDAERDSIIEIGAVKFRGPRVIETFQTFINPHASIPEFVQRLTGIRPEHLEGAPTFAVASGPLAAFLGSLPLVGHNVSFDLKFLARHGLPLSNPSYDTWDLASVLLPHTPDYSLTFLTKSLGVEHADAHRALADAQATHRVFVGLLKRMEELEPGVIDRVRYLAERSRWSLGDLLPGVDPREAGSGPGGFDLRAIEARLARPSTLKQRRDRTLVDETALAALASPGGLLSRSFPGYEHRPQQVEMMGAVARAFNQGTHLMAEAGTGVGKSLAYLLPAVLYALKNGTHVVVSTNTINLQEQLLQKDLPALVKVLEDGGHIPPGEFKAAPLKGRANYLCLRRWGSLSHSENLSSDEARLLSKTLVWLQETATGDRGEINLAGRDASLWMRISAGNKGRCPGLREGACFLRAARERAEAAHIIVVNHALLLSDLALGGGLLPDYQHLIIDEAHHLEAEATRQLGFDIAQGQLAEDLDALARALIETRVLLRSPSLSPTQTKQMDALVSDIEVVLPRLRDMWSHFWAVAEEFLWNHRENGEDRLQLRIARSTRAQPAWSAVEIAWENWDVATAETQSRVDRLYRYLDAITVHELAAADTLVSELGNWLEGLQELRDHLRALVAAPADDQRVDWITQNGMDSSLHLHSAPLNVATRLERDLFGKKRCVVLTGATLSTEGTFDYIRQRVGLLESDELLVGSPFDYSKAALLVIPDDIPEPGLRGYQEALEECLIPIAQAAQGHTLALFTSHGALRAARQAVLGPLEGEGIQVLAQGVDGSPHQLLRAFADRPDSLLLGTSSFWEGVDMPRGALKVLVLTRLPFNVPTEPIFAARSQLFEDPFNQYAVPQAVLRFRQGFGRLIRSSQDRGAVVVLDRRIISKSYGRAFLSSIPACTIRKGPLSAVSTHLLRWLQP